MKSSNVDSSVNHNGISTENLSKLFRNFHAVNSLTIDVSPGDIFGFLGPNGAGKTTTIRILCGLLSPSSGYAKVAGLDCVKDSLKIRSIIGLLPESSGYYNWMSAEEYLLYFGALYKIDTQTAKKRTRDLLEKVGLASRSYVPISYYSRGMKQRLGLARIMINEPRILFLDEPTLGLDPKGQQDIQKILLELNRDKGVTIFLSSHALSEVSSLCNRIAIVSRGRLIAQGNIDELRTLAGNSTGMIIRILNSQNAQRELSNLPYRIQTSITENNRLIDVTIYDENSDSANDIIDRFKETGFQIYEIRRVGMTLGDVYFKLTEAKKQKAQQTPQYLEQKNKGERNR